MPNASPVLAVAVFSGRQVERARWKSPAVALVALVVTMLLTWFIGPYARYQRDYGSPFVTNWMPSPRPHLFRESVDENRPGLTSIAHGLGTFRFTDMMRTPTTPDDRTTYPRHRTSYWSQVYGRAHHFFFMQWPNSWMSTHPVVMNAGRITFLAALLPSALLLLGLFLAGKRVIQGGLPGRLNVSEQWVVPVCIMGLTFIAFGMAYAIRLRDFSTMKDVFVLPAVAAFAVWHALGWTEVEKRGRSSALMLWQAGVLGLYALGAALLVVRLLR